MMFHQKLSLLSARLFPRTCVLVTGKCDDLSLVYGCCWGHPVSRNERNCKQCYGLNT